MFNVRCCSHHGGSPSHLKMLHSLQATHTPQCLRTLQVTWRASQRAPRQPGSQLSLQIPRAQGLGLHENQRATHPHLWRAKCPWEMGFFGMPVTCKTIKPEFCNPINKRIASFVLFLAKCRSSPLSFFSSLQPRKTHWEPNLPTLVAYQFLYVF